MAEGAANSLVCEASTHVSLFGPLSVPVEYFEQALRNPDAIHVASQLGRLDAVSVTLGALAVLIALGAFFGFWLIRRDAMASARDEAHEETPQAVQSYMDDHSFELVKACLSNAEIASVLHAEIMRLGIRDAATADSVDTDADIKETEEDAPPT